MLVYELLDQIIVSVFKVLHFVTYVCVILLTCCILWESYVFNEPVVVDPVQLLPPGSVGIFTVLFI